MKYLWFLALFFSISFATQCDDSWKDCIGNTDPCVKIGCWYWPPVPRNTVQKETIREFLRIIVERRYTDAAAYFALDATVNVPPFGISMTGLDKILGYLVLGDPDVSDLYEVVNATASTMVQEGDTVFVQVDEYLRVVTTGVIFPPNTVWEFQFNDLRQIQTWNVDVDGLSISSQLLPDLDLNPVTVCQDIQQNCVGANQQFANQTECVAALSSIRVFDGLQSLYVGNHLGCHSFHTILTFARPDIHCLHAGVSVISPIATPCTDPSQYI